MAKKKIIEIEEQFERIDLVTKSEELAVKIIYLQKRLLQQKEFTVSPQAVRSGMAIGAYIASS